MMARNWSLVRCFVLLIFLQPFSSAWKSSFVKPAKRPGLFMKLQDKDALSTGLSSKTENGPFNALLHKPLKTIQKLASIALLSSLLLTQSPDISIAVPSGSRSGGSSFRSSNSMRSSTRLNSLGGSYSLSSPSYRSSTTTTIIPVPTTPFFSPFSFGWGWGWGVSPFSFVSSPNLLLVGGLACLTYLLLANRMGGSDFNNFSTSEDIGSLGEGSTVIRLQIALEEDWTRPGNVMETFSRLAASKGRVQGRAQIAELLSEASLALLRKQDSWIGAAIDGERFSQRKASQAEPVFHSLAIQERAKFDKESNPNRMRRSLTDAEETTASANSRQPTKAVVSIVAAIRGQSRALAFKEVRSIREVASCLQALGSEALTDEGENVLAVEVLWTPSDRGDVLTAKDLVVDYPDLRSL